MESFRLLDDQAKLRRRPDRSSDEAQDRAPRGACIAQPTLSGRLRRRDSAPTLPHWVKSEGVGCPTAWADIIAYRRIGRAQLNNPFFPAKSLKLFGIELEVGYEFIAMMACPGENHAFHVAPGLHLVNVNQPDPLADSRLVGPASRAHLTGRFTSTAMRRIVFSRMRSRI